MNDTHHAVWRWIFGLALAAGCGSASTTSVTPGPVSAERVYETVAAHHRTILTMEGSGRISVQTPEIAQSGSFEIMLKKPDSLLLKIEGPFGIDVGTALVSRDRFQFYDVFQNRLIVGSTTPEHLERVFHLAMTFDDLLCLAAGGAFLGIDGPAQGNIERVDGSYVMTFAGDALSRRYFIDPTSLLITNVVFLRADGHVIAEQRFSDFRLVDGVLIPFELKMIQRTAQRMVSVHYSEVSVNQLSSAISFTVPENARLVQLQ